MNPLEAYQSQENRSMPRIELILAMYRKALENLEGARQAGCDAFVTKPCLPDALVAEINRMLALRDDDKNGRGSRSTGRTS